MVLIKRSLTQLKSYVYAQFQTNDVADYVKKCFIQDQDDRAGILDNVINYIKPMDCIEFIADA